MHKEKLQMLIPQELQLSQFYTGYRTLLWKTWYYRFLLSLLTVCTEDYL